MTRLDLTPLKRGIGRAPLFQHAGRLLSARGVLTCSMPAAVGDQCVVLRPTGERVLTEVIGFADRTAFLLPYDSADSLEAGMTVMRLGPHPTVPAGPGAAGRVIDALGRPID